MLISRADHGEFINWAAIIYFQLIKELIEWDKCQKNMIEGTAQRKPKKDVCHSAIVLEMVSSRRSKIIGEEKTSKRTSRGQKKKI